MKPGEARPDVPLPINYVLFDWRRAMNASYQEMLDTPYQVILQDLEYWEMEGTYGKSSNN